MHTGIVRNPWILLWIVSAVTLAVAYQFRAPIVLEMNSPAEEIYLTRGFYPNEETFGVTYRWTSGEAQAMLPGVGGGVPLKLHLQLHEFRPAPLTPNPVMIALNGHGVVSFTPFTDLAAYDFNLPASDWRGDAVIDLHSDTFRPPSGPAADQVAQNRAADQWPWRFGCPGGVKEVVTVNQDRHRRPPDIR